MRCRSVEPVRGTGGGNGDEPLLLVARGGGFADSRLLRRRRCHGLLRAGYRAPRTRVGLRPSVLPARQRPPPATDLPLLPPTPRLHLRDRDRPRAAPVPPSRAHSVAVL